MKKINYFVCALLVAYSLTSCKKENASVASSANSSNISAAKTERLLSKVSGNISSTDPNFFIGLKNLSWTFSATGDYSMDFSYDQVNALTQETFLNTGHYDFLYKKSYPYKIDDKSFIGTDYGYWKNYYDPNAQILKVGLAFSSTSDPLRFEFYRRNDNNQLIGFSYGDTKDSALFKVVYKYDETGNIYRFEIFMPVATLTSNLQKIIDYKNTKALSAKTLEATDKKIERLQSLIKNGYKNTKQTSSTDNSQFYLYLTAKVATDNRVNPFSQQNNILFYQTNRHANFYDINQFFASLLKSNPLRIEYSVPDWGSDIAVQTFTYTYDKGYPVTIHEVFTDPDFAFVGGYTQDYNIEYKQ